MNSSNNNNTNKKPNNQKGQHIQSRQPANPDRFLRYQLLEDETGFRIPNCDYVFKFDRNGGWFDEFGNYYNSQGFPCKAPDTEDDLEYEEEEEEAEAEEENHEEEYSDYDDYGDEFAEKLVNEYEDYEDNDEDAYDHVEIYEDVYSNIENKKRIEEASENSPITIEISNINFNSCEKDFMKFIENETNAKIKNYNVPYLPGGKKHKGKVIINVETKNDAQKIIKLNGKDFLGRKFKVLVCEQHALNEEVSYEVIIKDSNSTAATTTTNTATTTITTTTTSTNTTTTTNNNTKEITGVDSRNSGQSSLNAGIIQFHESLPIQQINASSSSSLSSKQLQEDAIKNTLGIGIGLNVNQQIGEGGKINQKEENSKLDDINEIKPNPKDLPKHSQEEIKQNQPTEPSPVQKTEPNAKFDTFLASAWESGTLPKFKKPSKPSTTNKK